MINKTRNAVYYALVAFILIVHSVLLAYNAWCHSPVYNEVGHLASGLFTWQTGRFDLFRVNPPLVRTVAAAPIALMGPKIHWDLQAIAAAPRYEYEAALRLMQLCGGDTLFYIRIARLACLPFSLIGAIVCFCWSKELFGRPSAIVAVLLWCFSPFILAHGALITSDSHSAALGITAAYCSWHWLKKPSLGNSLAAGVLLGVAIVSKFTLLILLPLFVILWLFDFSGRQWSTICTTWKHDLGTIIVAGASCLLVINATYLFHGTGTSWAEVREHFVQPTDNRDQEPRGLFAIMPIPLPPDLIYGIDIQRRDFENGKRCYLREQWRENDGWSYFYAYALLVKVPLGTQLLIIVTSCALIAYKELRLDLIDECVLILPAIAIFILVQSQTRMTIHTRYLLPAIPFVFVWVSRIGRMLTAKHWPIAVIVCGLMTWSVSSSVYYVPHSLSYFNELIGGPKNAGKHLLDSNVGWDQDLLLLKQWIDCHPEASSIQCVTLGLTPPSILGLDFIHPPFGPPKPGCTLPKEPEQLALLGPLPGWYAVDINRVYGFNDRIPSLDDGGIDGRRTGCDHSYFRYFEPDDMVGYSIYIYHIGIDEANRVRKVLGLPAVP